VVSFADYDAFDPYDSASLAGLFKDTPLVVNFGALAALTPTLTSLTGTLRATATVERVTGTPIAAPVLVDQYDQAGELNLPPGNYTHIVAFKEDGTSFTSAEVSALTVYLDAVPYVDTKTIAELADMWNQEKAQGGEAQTLSATAPIAGEAIAEQPGVGAGAGAAVSVGPYLPILVAPRGYKLSKVWRAESKVRGVWQGTLPNMRVVTRRLEELSDDQVIRAAAKVGVRATEAIPKTANAVAFKPGSPAFLQRLIPRDVK
jgi:hypothetical protein